uniref:Uncharacterized protein n=2 Tax=Picea TaxID=3328 RepID=A0A101LTY8_PICGL|nr:hypothetical protein ABT39_MTgene3462 [Picea glauca]QHR92891.1 hypothetical protein Q903MT_gene6940 [Picea sitchensis]
MIARSGVQPEHSGVERATVRLLNNRSRLLPCSLLLSQFGALSFATEREHLLIFIPSSPAGFEEEERCLVTGAHYPLSGVRISPVWFNPIPGSPLFLFYFLAGWFSRVTC